MSSRPRPTPPMGTPLHECTGKRAPSIASGSRPHQHSARHRCQAEGFSARWKRAPQCVLGAPSQQSNKRERALRSRAAETLDLEGM